MYNNNTVERIKYSTIKTLIYRHILYVKRSLPSIQYDLFTLIVYFHGNKKILT